MSRFLRKVRESPMHGLRVLRLKLLGKVTLYQTELRSLPVEIPYVMTALTGANFVLLYYMLGRMQVQISQRRRGRFRKVGENLYRYSSNDVYYAVFRSQGKPNWKSLETDDHELVNLPPAACCISRISVLARCGRDRPGPPIKIRPRIPGRSARTAKKASERNRNGALVISPCGSANRADPKPAHGRVPRRPKPPARNPIRRARMDRSDSNSGIEDEKGVGEHESVEWDYMEWSKDDGRNDCRGGRVVPTARHLFDA